jgi:hypothetical protein
MSRNRPTRPTRLARGMRQAMDACGCETAADAAGAWGVSVYLLRTWLGGEEPMWLRTLRTIRRLTGRTYDELLDGRRHADA